MKEGWRPCCSRAAAAAACSACLPALLSSLQHRRPPCLGVTPAPPYPQLYFRQYWKKQRAPDANFGGADGTGVTFLQARLRGPGTGSSVALLVLVLAGARCRALAWPSAAEQLDAALA